MFTGSEGICFDWSHKGCPVYKGDLSKLCLLGPCTFIPEAPQKGFGDIVRNDIVGSI